MPTDPWNDISLPSGTGVSARRADAEHAFDFYWARSHDGRCLLVLEYANSIRIRDKRPRLGEIRIIEPLIPDEPARFILELTQDENREIFHQLCIDIIESTRNCSDEKSALATMIRRTWRWHRMLKGGRDERLSPEKQKGLIGELRVLELAFLPRFSANDALEFWRGPERAPKDFSVGNVAIEAKAKRGSARPFVHISSESQLDCDALEALFLTITYVDESAPEIQESQTITDYISHIASIISANDPGSLGYFESRLDEAGYSAEHDYSDIHWIIGITRWYRVAESFPRIVHAQLPAAISKVEYNLDISCCDEWETDMGELNTLLGDGEQ